MQGDFLCSADRKQRARHPGCCWENVEFQRNDPASIPTGLFLRSLAFIDFLCVSIDMRPTSATAPHCVTWRRHNDLCHWFGSGCVFMCSVAQDGTMPFMTTGNHATRSPCNVVNTAQKYRPSNGRHITPTTVGSAWLYQYNISIIQPSTDWRPVTQGTSWQAAPREEDRM